MFVRIHFELLYFDEYGQLLISLMFFGLFRHRFSSAIMAANFIVKTDIFNGLTIVSKDQHHSLISADSSRFAETLDKALRQWTADGVRGVWFQISLEHSTWIPTLVANQFVYHHAQTEYVMMKRWLSPNEPDQMPRYPYVYFILFYNYNFELTFV